VNNIPVHIRLHHDFTSKEHCLFLKFARFRNRLRQRYYARRGKTLDPETLLNETGTADVVVVKTVSKSNKVVPENLSSKNGIDTRLHVMFSKRILTTMYLQISVQ
jgi:hypothetical protein